MVFIVVIFAYFIVGVYAAVTLGAFTKRRFNSTLGALLVSTLVLSVFFIHEIYSYISWQRACEHDAGIHIYKVVLVDGFFDSEGGAKALAPTFLRKGYKFIEDRKINGGVINRYSLGPTGVTREEASAPESSFPYITNNSQYSEYIWLHEQLVQNIRSREVIARSAIYGYSGGFFVALIRKLTGADKEGSATYCYGDSAGRDIILESIPPKAD